MSHVAGEIMIHYMDTEWGIHPRCILLGQRAAGALYGCANEWPDILVVPRVKYILHSAAANQIINPFFLLHMFFASQYMCVKEFFMHSAAM